MNPNLPIRYGAAFKSNAVLAANVSQEVFSVAANPNGAILWRASMLYVNSASAVPHLALAAHTAAPNSVVVGDVLASTDASSLDGTSRYGTLKLDRPVFIPAGKGLFFTSTNLEASGLRSALYTLL